MTIGGSVGSKRRAGLAAFVFLVLGLFLLFGCGLPTTVTPAQVPPSHTPFSPTHTPTSAPTSTATPTLTPPSLAVTGWEGLRVQALCLEISQTYRDMEAGFSEPLADYIQEVLEPINVEVAQPGESCEAKLTIQIIGLPLSGAYYSSGKCYTGSIVYGQASFNPLGSDSLWIPIDEKDEVDEFIIGCRKDPQDAPFSAAWSVGINKLLFHLWGESFLLFNQDRFEDELQKLGEANKNIPALVQGLQDSDPYNREHAALGLKEYGMYAASAIPILQQALSDDSPLVRGAVAEALAAIVPIGPQAGEVGQALIEAIHIPYQSSDYSDHILERDARAAEVRALGRCAPPEQSIPVLLEALVDQEYGVQLAAQSALGRIPSAIPALIEALDDPVADRRDGAANALGYFGPLAREAVPKLVVLLKEDDKFVRWSAINTLANIGPESATAVPALVEILHDPDEDLRGSAVAALRQIGPAALEAVPRLIELLDDQEILYGYASEALAAITGQDFGDDRAAWQAWWESQP